MGKGGDVDSYFDNFFQYLDDEEIINLDFSEYPCDKEIEKIIETFDKIKERYKDKYSTYEESLVDPYKRTPEELDKRRKESRYYLSFHESEY